MGTRFEIGDRVRTRAQVAEGHTRLPRYLAEKRGTVVAFCGTFPLADERARGIRDATLQNVYSVRFDARTVLDKPDDDRSHDVVADLWESYLEPER